MNQINTGNKILNAQFEGGLPLDKTSLWLSLDNNFKTGQLLSLLVAAVLYNKPPEGTTYTGVFVTPDSDIPELVTELYIRFKFAREDLKPPRDSIDMGIASAYVHRFAQDHGWQLSLNPIFAGELNDGTLDDILDTVIQSGVGRVPTLVLVDTLARATRHPPGFALERLNMVREERKFHLAVASPLDHSAKQSSREMPIEQWLAHTAKSENLDKELVDQADDVFVLHVTNHERLRGSLNTGEVTFQPAGARADQPAFVLELNDASTYPLNAV